LFYCFLDAGLRRHVEKIGSTKVLEPSPTGNDAYLKYFALSITYEVWPRPETCNSVWHVLLKLLHLSRKERSRAFPAFHCPIIAKFIEAGLKTRPTSFFDELFPMAYRLF